MDSHPLERGSGAGVWTPAIGSLPCYFWCPDDPRERGSGPPIFRYPKKVHPDVWESTVPSTLWGGGGGRGGLKLLTWPIFHHRRLGAKNVTKPETMTPGTPETQFRPVLGTFEHF